MHESKYVAVDIATEKFIDKDDNEIKASLEEIKSLGRKDFEALKEEVDKLSEDELSEDTKKK